MTWVDLILDDLAAMPVIGYFPAGKAAAEPTAIAALAFLAHERYAPAVAAAVELTAMQQENGEVSVRADEEWPGWPTSLAIVAWSNTHNSLRKGAVGNALRGVPSADALRGVPATGLDHESAEHPVGNALRGVPSADALRGVPSADALRGVPSADRGRSLQESIARAIEWLLANRGRGVERSDNFGHNTELVGWAYAEGTHSWVEPTAFAILALKAAGREYEAAAREGISVLIDRQLPGGGLNYGNTFVLGQLIRPHVQPTGTGLLALAGEEDPSGRLAKSIAWLRRSIGPQTTPTSLAWAVLGLTAHNAKPPEADQWLENAAARVKSRDESPYKLALLALAAKGWPQ